MRSPLRFFPIPLIFALLLPAAPKADDVDPALLLERMREANEDLVDLRGLFVHTKRVPLFEETITSRGELFYGNPDRLLLQYTEPDSNRVLIGDGQVWLYYPGLQQAHRYAVDPESTLPGLFLGLRGTLRGLEKNFELAAEEGERSDGYRTEILILRPREGTDLAGEVSEIRVTIRRDNALPVRTEFRESTGDETRFDFFRFERNTGLGEEIFRFDPPPGTELFELEGETW